MRTRPQLRSKLKRLLGASAGSAVLVVGGLQGCEVETTSGNLMAPDLVDEADVDDADSGSADTSVDSSVSGNLMPPDVDAVEDSDSATATTDTGGSEQ